MLKEKTLFIFGAGFSANLELPTTSELDKIISILCESGSSIEERINKIKKEKFKIDKIFEEDLKNTLTILFDDNNKTEKEAREEREKAIDSYIKIFKSSYPEVHEHYLRNRLEYDILSEIDWIAFKSIYSLFANEKNYNLVDILTIIQKAINDNISIPTKDIFKIENAQTYYKTPVRLIGALNAYKYLIYKLFKNFLRINREKIRSQKETYYNFFEDLIEEYVIENVYFLEKNKIIKKNFYLSNLGFLTFNWDPILPFLVMKTNQILNKKLLNQGNKNDPKLRLYVDFGFPFPMRKFSTNSILFSFSEETVFNVNLLTNDHPYSSRIISKTMKLFIPHGLVNMRICPRCQTPFIFWVKDISKIEFEDLFLLFLPDPIPNKEDLKLSKDYEIIRVSYKDGRPDKLLCPLCEHDTYFHHSFMEIQSILKPRVNFLLNKIYFEYANFFGTSQHIISVGYSFPKDDLINNYHLKIMSIQEGELKKPKITAILYDKDLQNKIWYKDPKEIKTSNEYILNTINSIKALSQEFRVSFLGFPNDKIKLEDLLNFQ